MRRPGENAPCWCGSGRKYKRCHQRTDKRLEEYAGRGLPAPPRRLLKSAPQIDGIRESGAVNGAVVDFVARRIGAGVTTGEIDRWVSAETAALGGIAAPFQYEGFPCSVCVSVNEEVCHGIPSEERTLKEGDIVNVDVSTLYQGYYSDASRMFCIGQVPPERSRLAEAARECMLSGLEQVRPWGRLGDVGAAVCRTAKMHGLSVVSEVGGHGIGLAFHEDPWVSYVTRAGTGLLLAPGLVFTVEPMINLGGPQVRIAQNGWTVVTADGRPSAQWEVTVAVTETGCELLAQ